MRYVTALAVGIAVWLAGPEVLGIAIIAVAVLVFAWHLSLSARER